MIAVAALIVALPAANGATSARRIATATVQPPRALADALTQFDRQFAAGFARGGGRPATATEKARVARMRTAGRAELSRQLSADGLPRLMALVERDYRDHFTPAELGTIAGFWTAPAGDALTRAMQQAGARGGTLTLPPEHRDAIATYLASPLGQKEAERSPALRTAMAREMTAFLQRAQPKITARIAAAGK